MSKWTLCASGYDREQAVKDGSRFLCANGYLGLRGVFEEADSAFFPAITLAGVYDQYQDRWREPVNAPHCLTVRAVFNGKTMAIGAAEPAAHSAGIDYGDALYHRETDFGPVALRSERFASMAEPHLMCDRIELHFAEEGELKLYAGISTDIWDINGPHLFDFQDQQGEVMLVRAVTGEKKITVSSAQCMEADFAAGETFERTDQGLFRVLRCQVRRGDVLSVAIFGAVYTSLDAADPAGAAQQLCQSMKARGYADCLAAHRAAWAEISRQSEILLEGDDAAALGLHASQYHLNSIAPRHARNLSIPARGLSGQTYKGAIFWDSEIFFFPMFVYTQPDIARSLLGYRIETLPGAIKKAAEYGFRGAFYAWESQEGGEEGCTNFNVVDVFTHRPVRTYFRDKQIHISADVAYALRSYHEITGDRSLLEAGGARVILECARFYISRACCHADRETVDFADVIGPDEYHERVTNNAFTNRMIRHTMESALKLGEIFADRADWFDGLLREMDYERDWQLLHDLCGRISQPVVRDGVIEQFDGYFALEDCSLDTVRAPVPSPRILGRGSRRGRDDADHQAGGCDRHDGPVPGGFLRRNGRRQLGLLRAPHGAWLQPVGLHVCPDRLPPGQTGTGVGSVPAHCRHRHDGRRQGMGGGNLHRRHPSRGQWRRMDDRGPGLCRIGDEKRTAGHPPPFAGADHQAVLPHHCGW